MFPITDFSRMDDIRMRRRRALALLVGIVVLGSTASNVLGGTMSSPITVSFSPGLSSSTGLSSMEASPAARSATGGALIVNLPCASSITVTPKSGQSRRVVVSTAEKASDDGISLVGGPTITLANGCRGDAPDVMVSAPASMPLTIVQTGGTDLRLGAFTSPVTLIQTGSGDMVVGGAGALKVSMTGEGDLSVGHLHGNLHLNQFGDGDVRIGSIKAVDVELNTIGSGDVAIAAGDIARLHAVSHGGGDLTVKAIIGNATVLAGDGSDVSLPHVTGQLVRNGVAGAAQP